MAIHIKEITDKTQWESFLTEGGLELSFFQSWNWGEVEKSLKHKLIRLGFFEDNLLVGVASIAEINARRGKYLHVRNGPVLDWTKPYAEEVIRSLKVLASSQGKDYVRISPLIEIGSSGDKLLTKMGLVESQMHDVDAEVTWVLDITQSEADILKNMRKNTRYYIRKAEKDGVIIEQTNDPERLSDFWPIYEDTYTRQKWNAYSLDYIKNEFAMFAPDNQAQLFLAKYQGKYIAASIFIYYKDECFYHHSGSLSEYKKVTAPYLLQWKSILEAKNRGLKKYNFFGIARTDDPNHPWAGLSFFKKGFGGFEQRWIHARDLPIKKKYWITHYFEKIERKRRGY